jgi:hypothetical protein
MELNTSAPTMTSMSDTLSKIMVFAVFVMVQVQNWKSDMSQEIIRAEEQRKSVKTFNHTNTACGFVRNA